MRLLSFVLVAAGLFAAPVASGGTDATGRCGEWAVPARISGKAVCLREDRACAARFAAQYLRHGLDCLDGRLDLRWSYLTRRPVAVPALAPGALCPVTTKTGKVGGHAGLGRGPAYPLGTHSVVTMPVPPPERWGDEWSGTKRVWLLDTRYAERALVRGRQLDGPEEVRFVLGPSWTAQKLLNPLRELRLRGPDAPSLTRLRAPGCYAYQVDGLTFSYLVVFEARVEAP